MIHTKTGSGRRILTFPAVKPCKSISILTLLNSLSQLATDILTFKPKHFSTNKQTFRQTLRQIQNLLLVFHEIRIRVENPDLYFPDSAVLSLSEIHVIFQKLKFLVEDCTRNGARIYMLTKSNQVSDHLRVLTRSISISLSSFPLASVDLPTEVNELINLIVQHSGNSGSRSDPDDDKRVISSVNRILALFENRINPNRDEINQILDHIGITNWGDCVKEINFLVEEIEMNKNNNGGIELLSSLMAFISYCRCVILGRIERDDDNHQESEKDQIMIRGLKIEDLLCPISLEIMMDPVILETGHTYDRNSITKWFRSGNISCPKTGKNLATTEFVDNISVKRMIHYYCKQNGVVLAGSGLRRKIHDVVKESLAAEGVGRLIARFLTTELINGDEEMIYRAVREIRVLTKISSFNRSCLVEAGAVKPLLRLLSSGDSRIQEISMAGILNLCKCVDGKSRIAENDDGLRIIIEILNDGVKTETRLYASSALFYLSSIEDYSRLIGENRDSISGLMKIVNGAEFGDSGKRNALLVVMSLLKVPDNHWRVLAAGFVPVLLDLLRSGEIGNELMADSLATLAKLTEYPDGTIGVIRRGGLKLAVKILSSSELSPAVKKQCVALLLNLCINGGSDVVGELVKNQLVIMGSLYTVLSNGECGGSKDASAVIRMIHEFQERRTGSSGLVEPKFQRGRFIHAW